MIKDNIFTLVFAAVALAATVAWLSEKIEDKPAGPNIDVEVNAVEVAKPVEEDLPSYAASIPRESNGQYWTRADVDGSSIKFLVDTGASVVALTWDDARRLDFDVENLDFRWTISTANGETKAASVLLPFIRVGNVKIENVEAMILKEGALKNSLLGMSFLGELYSFEFRGARLIIRQ